MFDAYKIAVTISLTNYVSAHLTSMAKDFKGTEEEALKLQNRINGIRSDALKGGLMLGVGAGMLMLLKGPYEEAKKLAQAQANFQTLNLSSAENAEAFAKAASMSHRILGTTITDNVKSIHDLHTAFGDLRHAIGAADEFAKFSFIAKTMNDGKPVEGLVYSAAKALEHRGGKVMNDDGEFKSELDLMGRVYLGSRGKVNPTEFFHASQTGKMAYTLMDKEELYGPFAAYMQAKTGSTAGTASMTFASSLIGGHMTDSAKGFMADLGLWNEGSSKERLKMLSKIRAGMSPEDQKSMGLIQPSHGGLKDEFIELATHRQSEFIQKVMVPAIHKRFGMNLTDEQIATMLMTKFNRNTSDFMGEYVVNAMKFKKDAAIFKGSKGIGAAYQHYLKTPEGAEEAASAAFKNFLAVFGSIYLPAITKGLLSLAGALDGLGKFVEKNKMLITGLVGAFGILAGGLMMRGTVLLLSAAFRGLGLSLLMGGGARGLVSGLASSIGLLANPIGIAVLAIGTIAAACYAFSPLTKKEINEAKWEGGANLSPNAAKRVASGELQSIGNHDFVRKSSVPPLVVHTSVMLNDKVLATAINKANAQALNAPQAGIGRMDLNRMALSPGMNIR